MTTTSSILSRCAAASLIASSLTSCGIGFQSRWSEAKTLPSSGAQGRWTGTWKSEVNGHTGKLRCVVSHPKGTDQHSFLYRATWMKVLAATFKTAKTVTPTAQGATFVGEKNLGVLGGTFRCKGSIKDDHFQATYESAVDHGVFEMERVK